MNAWLYKSYDGSEWVVRAETKMQARLAAHNDERRRTESVAAANLAAASVQEYRPAELQVADAFTPPDPFSRKV